MIEEGIEPIQIKDNIYNIRSQSSNRFYTVIEDNEGWSCSCPDHTYRNTLCKHIRAILIWRGLKEKLQDSTIETPRLDATHCKYCESVEVIKNGTRRNKYGIKNRYLCKTCGRTFVLDEDGFSNMKFDPNTVTKCLDLYFKGASLRAISDHMEQFHDIEINFSTITRWIKKYTAIIDQYVSTLEPRVSNMWHADEMMISVKDNYEESKRENLSWLWNVMDTETRFLLASLISKKRSVIEAKKVFKDARETAKGLPDYIVTDGLHSYNRAVATELSTADKFVRHVKGVGVKNRIHNNKVERLHGTVRDREKTMRGIDNEDSAKVFIDGFRVYYNYIRPHKGLNGRTPAQEAGIDLDLGRNRWMGLIKKGIEHQKNGA
jgi:transposase-like protein